MDTERLYLREQTTEDLDRLYEIYQGDSIRQYVEPLYEDYEEELAFTKAYIQNMYQFYGYGMWVVCLKKNDLVIGRAGLGNREVDGINRLELGYLIADEYQGRGYAKEACLAICDFARDRLDAEQMICLTEPENVPSVKLLERLGFEYSGQLSLAEGM